MIQCQRERIEAIGRNLRWRARIALLRGLWPYLCGTLLCLHAALCFPVAAGEPDALADKLPLVLPWGHRLPIITAAFSADGKFVVSGSQDHTAIVWDAQSGRQLATLAAANDMNGGGRNDGGQIMSVAISADARYVATTSKAGALIVWDTAASKKRRTLVWHNGPIAWLVFRKRGPSCSVRPPTDRPFSGTSPPG